MTESVLDTRQDTADYDDPPPMRRGMPVTIVEDDTAPDLAVIGSFRTITLTGAEQPFRLLAQDRRRKKATVLVKSDPSYAPTQFVLQNGGNISGAAGTVQVGNVIDLGPLGSDISGVAAIVTVANMTGTAPSVQFSMQTSDDPLGIVGWTTLATSSPVTTGATTRVQFTGPIGRYIRLLAINWANADNVAVTVAAVATASTSEPLSEYPQSVILARQGQVSNAQGAVLYAGDSLIYEAESEIWCIPQVVMGHVLVSVIEERKTPRD